MLTEKELKTMENIVKRERGILDLQKKYEEYKEFDTPRWRDKMELNHIVDDYNKFMDDAEAVLFLNEEAVMPVATMEEEKEEIVIPKPSKKLEDFKNKFGKFF